MHAQSYGYSDSSRAVEIVTLRIQAIARSPRSRAPGARLGRTDARHAAISSHRIFVEGHWRKAILYDRAHLLPGNRIAGPAVIVELSATTYLASGWNASVDGFNNLILTPQKREH